MRKTIIAIAIASTVLTANADMSTLLKNDIERLQTKHFVKLQKFYEEEKTCNHTLLDARFKLGVSMYMNSKQKTIDDHFNKHLDKIEELAKRMQVIEDKLSEYKKYGYVMTKEEQEEINRGSFDISIEREELENNFDNSNEQYAFNTKLIDDYMLDMYSKCEEVEKQYNIDNAKKSSISRTDSQGIEYNKRNKINSQRLKINDILDQVYRQNPDTIDKLYSQVRAIKYKFDKNSTKYELLEIIETKCLLLIKG